MATDERVVPVIMIVGILLYLLQGFSGLPAQVSTIGLYVFIAALGAMVVGRLGLR